MKIYIHDKCMEQLFELPKGIQKKVLEFQRKFRYNSKSSAIHLEPISTFRDPLLRTARIDDKYRAIVKVPSNGDDYYLLWVDNHDEAMDWAKNKVFHWNDNTQTAQIFTAPEEKLDVRIDQQIQSKSLFASYSDKQLVSIGVPEQSLNLIRSIKDLNELGESEKYLPVDVYENLFYLSDGANYELLLAEINEGKAKSSHHEDQVASINNRRAFIEMDDALMTEIINGDLSKWQIFLHPSQRKLVEAEYKGSVKITGGAGTGKTVVALHRLKYLSSLPENSKNKRIVFTTYTNALTSNLTQLAKKLSIDLTKVILTNIDSLVRDLSLKYRLLDKDQRVLDSFNSKASSELWDEVLEHNLSEFDVPFLTGEYQEVILYNDVKTRDEYFKISRVGRGQPLTRKQRIDVWRLVEIYNAMKKSEKYLDRSELFNLVSNYNLSTEKPFSHVIADEIQDLSNVELRFLRSLVEQEQNDLFLVGDPYQKVYARKINFTAAGISVRGTRSRQLRINYRTSEEIKRLAISSIQGLKYDDFDGESEKLNGYISLFHGARPTYELFKTKDKEIDNVIEFVNLLHKNGYNYQDIAIGCRVKDSIKEIKSSLHKSKIPYADNSISPADNHEGIVLSTFHSLKGLEFKAVILADVNNRTAPLYFRKFEELSELDKEEYLQRERSLLYVAMTRAIAILNITGTGIASELIKV
jgi:mRNA-degrading endonuclease RelE of RelBE toxin-antitoxin system